MQTEAPMARLLGTLFYTSPSSETVTAILHEFGQQQHELLNALADSASQNSVDELETDFFTLLQGGGDMPCPPWGSAYLDNENALFGASTLEYRAFLNELGLHCDTGVREPEDHIGLMLMLLSVLWEKNDTDSSRVLLQTHLLPFAFVMLEEMQKHAQTAFYQDLALFTENWLKMVAEESNIEPANRRIYWERV